MADSSSSSSPISSPSSAATKDPARTRRQQGLFLGGVLFVLVSATVTRRALVRRNRPIAAPVTAGLSGPSAAASAARNAGQPSTLTKGVPKSSQAAGYKSAAEAAAETEAAAAAAEAEQLNSSGPILAMEALTLATLNVFSWTIMATGGLLWYLDIASMDDLRRRVRGGLGVDGTGRTEQEAEEEMEEWLATVLARKEDKKRAEELRVAGATASQNAAAPGSGSWWKFW